MKIQITQPSRQSYSLVSKPLAVKEQEGPLASDLAILSAESQVTGLANIGTLQAGLLDNYGSPSISKVGGTALTEEKRLKNDLMNFEERLPTSARETFQELDLQKKREIMELGMVFAGSAIEGSPLLKLMEDGRLFEKDSSGATPLQRLTEITTSSPTKTKANGNFFNRVLEAVENPGKSRDAKKRGLTTAENSPSEFIRKAGEDHMSAQTLNQYSELDDSPLES